jgi:hypothetical protein
LARILLLLVIGFLVYALFRGFFKSQVKDKDKDAPGDARDGVEDMVACSLCGVNMPRSESKEEGGRVTCRDPGSCKHAG